LFIDRVKVQLLAGKGGDGCVSFRREYRVPKGGPDGGRGGDGGNIYLISDQSLNSLAFFRFHPINKARKGANGQGSNRQGKKGQDLYLRVPVGTMVKEASSGRLLHDFLQPGEIYLAAKGGRGGRGNASFATSTHQVPREFEKGKPGQEIEAVLELKLIADVGLVGFPNAGKSTLIKTCSGAVIPTSGKIIVNGKEFTSMSPQLAAENGIAIIYQEFNNVKGLSAAENLFLGNPIRNGLLIDKKAMEREAEKAFAQLNIKIDPKKLCGDLTVGYQQMVEIAKAIKQNAKVLIMDEPSAPLTSAEVESMFKVCELLKSQGVSIIYISHRSMKFSVCLTASWSLETANTSRR